MFSSHVSVTYVKLCLCTNLWEPVWDSLVQKSWRQQFFTVKAFRMWHEAILFVHCKECSLSSVASQHAFCVVLQMISSFLFCSCANVWVRMWEYAYVLLSILYDGLWVQVCACMRVCVLVCPFPGEISCLQHSQRGWQMTTRSLISSICDPLRRHKHP